MALTIISFCRLVGFFLHHYLAQTSFEPNAYCVSIFFSVPFLISVNNTFLLYLTHIPWIFVRKIGDVMITGDESMVIRVTEEEQCAKTIFIPFNCTCNS